MDTERPPAGTTPADPYLREAVEQPTAVRRATLALPELRAWFAKTYGEVGSYLTLHGITPRGYPFARYQHRPDGRFDVEAGYVVTAPIAGDTVTVPSSLPGGLHAVVWHIGPYQKIGATYAQLTTWIESQSGRADGAPWEFYHDPPGNERTLWRTEIVQPYVIVGDPR
ncbi:hypothetical protein GCM10009554_09010 [Kribbella koreensis]|uniref:AraC effector-binding domain-containing protein n=2 Tax=Kribbella TaxID=182639 RepID=A0ABP6YXA2_9ACTN